jgi:hypothetical protein
MYLRMLAAELTINLEFKCTGGRPSCVECETNNILCIYEERRKDRLKDPLDQKQLLVALSKDLRQSVSDRERVKIEDVLRLVSIVHA